MLNPIQIIRYTGKPTSLTNTPNIVDVIKATFRFLIYPLTIALYIFFALTHSVYTRYFGGYVFAGFLISLILYITDIVTLCIKLIFKKTPKKGADKACLVLSIYELMAVVSTYLCYIISQ